MTKSRKELDAQYGESPLYRMLAAVKAIESWSSYLGKFLIVGDPDLKSIRIVPRQDAYMVVIERYWETEQVFVVFVSGDSILQARNTAISKYGVRDAWKVQTPYKGK